MRLGEALAVTATAFALLVPVRAACQTQAFNEPLLEASRAKSVDLRVETADSLPREYGYGSELNQVWEQLIDNAIAAVQREGSVTVTANTRGDSIVVRVTDDGPGIPEENRWRGFDPFSRRNPWEAGPDSASTRPAVSSTATMATSP